MEKSDSTIMLPPYWFDAQNPQHKEIKSRIAELEKLQKTIADELNYLKSIISS